MRPLLVLSAVVGVGLPGRVEAGCACGAWEQLPVSLNVCLVDETGACETPLTEAARAAVSNWRAFVDLWQVVPPARDVAAPQDGLHSVALRSVAALGRLYGADVAPWVLGITFAPAVAGLADGNAQCPLPAGLRCPVYGDGPGEDVDVVLVAERSFTTDPLRAWASHLAGNAAPVWDAHQVLEHELGHALGLRHESRVASLMNPFHLEFPGVVALGDDARAARAAYPAVVTEAADLAVVGFVSRDGTLLGAFAETDPRAPLRAGVDSVRVSGFTVTNRGARPLAGIVTEIRIGEAVAGTLVCDLPAYGDCALFDVAEVVVPPAAGRPGGHLPLSIHVPALIGEPILDDNTLLLGYVDVERGAAPDLGVTLDAAAALGDALVLGADAGGTGPRDDRGVAPGGDREAASEPGDGADADPDGVTENGVKEDGVEPRDSGGVEGSADDFDGGAPARGSGARSLDAGAGGCQLAFASGGAPLGGLLPMLGAMLGLALRIRVSPRGRGRPVPARPGTSRRPNRATRLESGTPRTGRESPPHQPC